MAIDRERILGMVEQMPTFPASAHRIIELSNDVNCAPRDLVDTIEHDPILTLKVLKLINSSYFSLASEVTSVKHAVVYLGINSIKNLALSVATIGALPRENLVGFNMGEFWLHSLLTAGLGRIVASRRGVGEDVLSNCFVGGLLHDVGKVVLVQFLSEQYTPCLEMADEGGRFLFEIEAEVLGVTHAELGALVAERWKLPGALVECIGNHHSLQEESNPSIVDCALFAGNQLSKLAMVEDSQPSPVLEDLPDAVASWLAASLDETFAGITELPDEIDRANMFIEMGG